jgi:hypothetical protein
MALAVDWHKASHITESARDDIVTSVNMAPFSYWRPLIFVVPYSTVAGRVEEVPRPKRASMEPEYIIRDLKMDEFGIIEP